MTLTKRQALLYKAVTNIADEYIEEGFARPVKSKGNRFKRFAAIAATLVLLFGMSHGFKLIQNIFSKPSIYVSPIQKGSFFAITAQASDGKDKVLDESLFSAVIPGHSIPDYEHFPDKPTDMAEFQFLVHLPKSTWFYMLLIEYDDIISYNGAVVGEYITNPFEADLSQAEENKNLTIFHVGFTGSDKGGYRIRGWFEEPTVMSIKLISKETHTIVQKQVLYIEYNKDKNNYTLSLIDDVVYTTTQRHLLNGNGVCKTCGYSGQSVIEAVPDIPRLWDPLAS